MARIRTIKPEFFYSEQVTRVSHTARLLFVGMWTLADREGRLEWSPRKIRAQLFPYEEQLQIFPFVEELVEARLIWLYESGDSTYACIPGFTKHQRPHPKEPASILPPPPEANRVEGVTPWKPSREHVYFVRNTGTGAIKIGRTKQDVAFRIRELQTGSSAPLELILAIPGDSAREISLQKELAQYRIGGEWFTPHEDVLGVINRERKFLASNTQPSIPLSPVGREGKEILDKGKELSAGEEAPRVRIQSVPIIRRRDPSAAHEHPRYSVPGVWHEKRVDGLSDGEFGMHEFYKHLDAHIEAHPTEDAQPIFEWLTRHFDTWVKARRKPAPSCNDVPDAEETRRLYGTR